MSKIYYYENEKFHWVEVTVVEILIEYQSNKNLTAALDYDVFLYSLIMLVQPR